jgi:hypothetical protein
VLIHETQTTGIYKYMMNTSADVSLFHISPLSCILCWILIKPVLGSVHSSLHIPLLSMNRLNQIIPTTLSEFFRASVYPYFVLITDFLFFHLFLKSSDNQFLFIILLNCFRRCHVIKHSLWNCFLSWMVAHVCFCC